ncbi:hypothetical protein [Promineifilum sp.]|uniref:recombination directionality factor n=1 Tax=Promineifilum sp. TaxID=2664178 RepID=UPI0035B2E2C3
MIKAHEQQLELRLPRIGVIRKGGKMTTGARPQDTRPGKDLDHFRLDRADPAVAAAWLAAFGPEPKTISGFLPYADPAENLRIWDELWQGKRLLWRGDGERLHVKLDGNTYVRYAPGEGPAQPAAAGQKVGSGKVGRLSRLCLLLPQLRVAGIFEIMSSSAIDADELWANLMWIRSTVATLQGAPVTVFRAPRQFNVPKEDGTTMAVTKHMLHMALDGRYLDALLPKPAAPMLAPPAAPMLSLTGPAAPEDDAPDEDDGDAEWEDAPPTPATNGNGGGGHGQPPDAGPLPDDELTIDEAPARDFVNVAAALLDADADTVKARMKAMGYAGIPGKPADRVAVYRRLKADLGENVQAALFGAEPEPVKFVDPA